MQLALDCVSRMQIRGRGRIYQDPRADGGKGSGERLLKEARCLLLRLYIQPVGVQLALVQHA